MEPIRGAVALIVIATLLASVAAISRLDDGRRWRDVLRDRFVFGVPWGTAIVLAGVLAVYLFVQDGITDFENPVTIPFRAWSYYYPLGIASASFTHVHDGHLFNNLFAAAVVGPLAEYVWGHYPNGRDAHETTSWWTTPWVRAVAIFPLGVVAVGVLTSAFALGPVIGFSGVVFAFAGFAIVRYPITTVVAVLGGQTALLTVYRALQTPIGVYVAESSPPSPPSWATIAIQGHALGFLVGLVASLLLLERRFHRPNPLRIWVALVLFAFAQGLWAIYWFGDENTFLLFRGPGVVIVLALALLVTFAIVDADRTLLGSVLQGSSNPPDSGGGADCPDRTRDRILEVGLAGAGDATARLDRLRAIAGGSPTGEGRTPGFPDRRRSAFVAVLLVVALVAGPAIPVNLFVADGASSAEEAVTVDDYTVFYDEGVENELVSFVDVSLFGQDTRIEANGVIVTSEERHLWTDSVSAQRLAFTGEETVYVGGPGWREAVHVERTGWTPVGNDTVYRVEIWPDGGERQLAYESARSRADVLIDERNVSVISENGEFLLAVESDGTVETTSIPGEGESTSVGGLTFDRDGDVVYAVSDGTEVAVATRETYD